MSKERLLYHILDIREAESLTELEKLQALGVEYEEARHPRAFEEVEARKVFLLMQNPQDRLSDLMSQLQKLGSEPIMERQFVPVIRASRKYKLVKEDVSWSTKPQVHAVMQVLKSVVKVGEVVDEDRIVEAMRENVAVLNTRQDGRRIWDYYKGDSGEGLLAHGIVEKL